ncbi:MAG: hypothetical protein ACI9WC_000131 [Arenicella sp.]|jgi:hypothetical protein
MSAEHCQVRDAGGVSFDVSVYMGAVEANKDFDRVSPILNGEIL